VLRKKYFVMHCHRNNEIIVALMLRFTGGNFKLLSTRHAESPPSFLTRYLLKKSDVVIALTKRMLNTISFPAVVVGHGVNREVFSPQGNVVKPGISQKNILLCAGRVREAKGQRFLLEALSPIIKQFPDWALAIIGKADKPGFLKELKEIVARHSVESQVYFIPETRDIASYYRASHSVVVPSFTEGFSLVCAEAMSCGCNVLATRDVGIHSELITDGKNGYLFDARDKVGFRNLLMKLFKGELVHLGEYAQKEIVDNWSSRAEANMLMGLYKQE
jgi:mannosyltransferase